MKKLLMYYALACFQLVAASQTELSLLAQQLTALSAQQVVTPTAAPSAEEQKFLKLMVDRAKENLRSMFSGTKVKEETLMSIKNIAFENDLRESLSLALAIFYLAQRAGVNYQPQIDALKEWASKVAQEKNITDFNPNALNEEGIQAYYKKWLEKYISDLQQFPDKIEISSLYLMKEDSHFYKYLNGPTPEKDKIIEAYLKQAQTIIQKT